MSLTITSVDALPDDTLVVTAHDDNDTLFTATGHVSATTNHYDADLYGDDGHLLPDAKPRAMTADEVGAYALALLQEQNPELRPAATPEPVAFAAPAEAASIVTSEEVQA